MIEFKIDVDGIDYKSLIPTVVPMVIKNKIAAKAAIFTIETKLRGKTETEKNAFVVNYLQEHKNKIIEALNEKVKGTGITGYVCNFDADII